jgi:photosystem II stability/assembly factor-like uncharacterized protein
MAVSIDRTPVRTTSVALLLLFVALPGIARAGVGEWTSRGPEGAAVQALANHWSDPSTVYAATARRLYKSVDAGASWAPTGLADAAPDVVLPTRSPSVVYAVSSYRYGFLQFYRTTDGGETWVSSYGPSGNRIISLAADAYDVSTVYASTEDGLFRTRNAGDSWESLPKPVPGPYRVTGLAAVPDDDTLLFASTGGSPPGVYRSSDRGATWSRTGLREPAASLFVGPPASNSGVTFALFAVTSNGLQVTTDLGRSWRRIASGYPSVSQLAIDPADSNRLYILSRGVVLQSSDGGQTMTPLTEGNFGRNLTAIVASRSPVVLVGSERGVSRSEDGGRIWAASNHGMRDILVKSLAIDPTDPAVVFAASSQGIRESRDGGESWIEPVAQSPDAEVVAIDPSNRTTLYAAGTGGVHKSTDGGRTWQNRLVDQIADLVIDPSNPRRLLAAYKSVYRSLDGTESWDTVITPEDNYSSYYYPPRLSAITLAPSNGATVYAAGAGDIGFVYRSDDGGNSWSDPTDLGFFWINALGVDSCDPRVLQAGGYGGVQRSVDGGNTWSQRQLAGISVLALATDPRRSSSVFAGTSSGLFWTNDSGETWARFDPPLTEAVHSLALDASGRFLYAGTERGVFRLERSFEPCRDGPDRLCLIGAKYQVSVTARDPRTGAWITGRAIEEGDRFGYFSFPGLTGDPSFPEVVVKMVDASDRPPPYGGHAWVFHSSLTDLDYTLTVLETDTGRIRTYDAADSGSLTCGRADTSAFERDCAARVSASRMPEARLAAATGAELSLLGRRFRATIRATDSRTGRVADGAAIPRADGFGYFSLPDFTGDPSFPEVFVKMIDATKLPGGYFWVFHTGLTDLDYTLTVTDVVTGAARTYSGGATDGTRLCGSADTMAFRN